MRLLSQSHRALWAGVILVVSGCACTVPMPSSTADSGPNVRATAAPAEGARAPVDRSAGAQPSRERAQPAATPIILETPRFANLIDRIQAGFAMPELDTPLVAQHERWIARNPQYLQRVFDRGGKYLFHIVEELEARNMPTELALLPIVESAFNPQALSRAKAAGLWQFIPSTGRIFDLEQNWWTDQRRDVIESTRAALDYLQKLYDLQDNDWFLALASYNWGEGAVMRARKANARRKKATGYLDLNMPKETRNYVPKLIALRNVLAAPSAFGITLPTIPNKPFFIAIDKEQSIDLALAAQFAGMSVDEFVELNPSHHRPVISASRTNRIILPADRAESFQRALASHLARGEPLVTWKPYTLKPSETLAALARRAGVSTSDLIKANSLKRNAQPLPGTVLLAPVAAQEDEPHIETTLAKFTGSKVIEKERLNAVYHRVTKRDTLAKIAKRYGVSQAQIRRLNKIDPEAGIAPGQRLLIRNALTQTVVTDERGKKTVVASAAEEAPEPTKKPAASKSAAKPAAKSAPNKKAAETKAASKAPANQASAGKSNPEKK